jgi:hypothetical protein
MITIEDVQAWINRTRWYWWRHPDKVTPAEVNLLRELEDLLKDEDNN